MRHFVKKGAGEAGLVLALLVMVVFVSGCLTGPVRYKTLGRYKYATVEFTDRSPPLGKPFAAVGGVLTDGAILAADTIVVPVVSIPISVKMAALVPFAEPGGFERHPVMSTTMGILFFPIYLPWSYGLNLYFQSYGPEESSYSKSFYPEMYGDESKLFLDIPRGSRGQASKDRIGKEHEGAPTSDK